MNLNSFEDEISKVIVSRGLDYYRDDCVKSIHAVGERKYLAQVDGTDSYSVEVALDEQGNIMDSSCDCPYDYGPYCKHQTAVLFALRDLLGDGETDDPDEEEHSVPESGEKPAIVPLGIRDILMRQSKDQLVSFLCRLAEDDDDLTKRIEWTFDVRSDDNQLKQAKKLIRDAVRSATRGGFIDYRSARRAVYGAERVMESAREALSQSRPLHAARLALCTMAEMVKTLQGADDSDGFIGGVVQECIDLLTRIGKADYRTKSDDRELLRLLTIESENARYDGWTNWRLDLLGACRLFVHSPTDRSQLELRLDKMLEMESAKYRDTTYMASQIALMRYHLVKQLDGDETASRFILKHIDFAEFRVMAIKEAFTHDNFAEVLRLTEEGIQKDAESRGLVISWMKYQYRAFEKLGDVEAQKRLAFDFVMDGDAEYYDKLHGLYSADDWPRQVQVIINRLEERRYPPQLYTKILIAEGETGRLLEHVKRDPTEITRFHVHLMPQYPEETKALFLDLINRMAKEAHERGAYQKVCEVINTLAKSGGQAEARKVCVELMEKHIRRPAFRDELNQMKL